MTPTPEQQLALETALQNNSFKIVAYAGAGKTSTLKLISDQKKGRGLYLAFNKAIATDAQSKFSGNVRCQTFHSLAYRHVPRAITTKLALPKQTSAQVAQSLNLTPFALSRSLDGRARSVLLTHAKLGDIINESLVHFCKTSSAYPAPRHIVLPDWVSDNERQTAQNLLYPALETRWLQAIDARHPFAITHDIYLKLWTLSDPIIAADYVLFDEAQDANPLMMGVLMKQPCQTIFVGDAHQQIYEWRGAINAMKRLPFLETKLTQSFRFGTPIADIANVFLRALQETTPLIGNPNTQSTIIKTKAPNSANLPNAVLCRTNASAVAALLRGQASGHKVALQADSARILQFCRAAESLQQGRGAFGVPELNFFKHWDEVRAHSETSGGFDLKTWVNLIDSYGTKTLERAITGLAHPKAADYIISTAHKAKGLEWNAVQIYDDFLFEDSKLSIKISQEELRLLYVACTRAKNVLNVGNVAGLIEGLQSKKVIYD